MWVEGEAPSHRVLTEVLNFLRPWGQEFGAEQLADLASHWQHLHSRRRWMCLQWLAAGCVWVEREPPATESWREECLLRWHCLWS